MTTPLALELSRRAGFLYSQQPRQKSGDPILCDETLEHFKPESVQPGDIVGIGIHTGNALRGYAVGRLAKERGAHVIYGGIHTTLFPTNFRAWIGDAVVTGDGDIAWPQAVRDCAKGSLQRVYKGGRVSGKSFLPARWDLLPKDGYMWASCKPFVAAQSTAHFVPSGGPTAKRRVPAMPIR